MTRRTRWYEPRIDPAMADYIVETAMYGRSMPERVQVDFEPNDFDHAPNLIGSLCEGETISTAAALHMPVIDFDAVPMRLAQSSTPGNFRLYIDKPITWAQYVPILEALDAAGLVEHEYVVASIRQGSTFVRPEGYKRYEPRKINKFKAGPFDESIKAAQARAQSDSDAHLSRHNLISGVCCGDPGDCTHECGMGRH